MSKQFIAKHDYILKAGDTYALFDNGEIIRIDMKSRDKSGICQGYDDCKLHEKERKVFPK